MKTVNEIGKLYRSDAYCASETAGSEEPVDKIRRCELIFYPLLLCARFDEPTQRFHRPLTD